MHTFIDPSNKQIEFKFKLGVGSQKDQREEMEPLKDLGPAIRATLHTEEFDSNWDKVININLSMT